MAESDPVRAQYEAYPYPPRDPADEKKRLVTGSPSHLAEIVHYVRGGAFDPSERLRVLVAGGGTGDAAIMIAQQLVDAGATTSEVVYLDWSQASRRIAEARARVRGLANLRFVTGSLLDLATLGLDAFDYIDCCGVLHHLPDPEVGLAALEASLTPGGGMGLMLYAPLGRIGVYHVQDALRALEPGTIPAERLALGKRLLANLPATNWLKRNPFVTDHIVEGDAGLYDVLLHERDRAYSVDEVCGFVDRAGLRLVSFVPPGRYQPQRYVSDAALLKRMDGLDSRRAAALAESLAGNIKSHAFYVVRADNPVRPPEPDSLDRVPVPVNIDPAELARGVAPGAAITAGVDGLQFRLPIPRLGPAILARIDGRKSLRTIRDELPGAPDEATMLDQFQRLFVSLNALGKLALRARA